MRFVCCCCCALALGCTPTAVVVDVTLGAHDAPPATLTASVFDPHHALLFDHAIGNKLPGRLTLTNLPAMMVPLRIALDGNGGLEAGVGVTLLPGATAHATALLSAATPDRDGDGVPDVIDNCPTVPNPMQQDTSGGAQGDACRGPGGGGDLGIHDLAAPAGSDLAGSDLATSDLAAANTDCPSSAIVCDGFESGIGPVWHVDNDPSITVGTDSTHYYRGTHGLHFHSPATSASYVNADVSEQKSQPLDDTWMRVFVYVPTANEPYGATLVQLYQNNAGFNYVELQLDAGGHLELVDTQPPTFNRSANSAFPTDRWVCLEWHFHELPAMMDLQGASGESEVWLDGNDVPELHISSGLQAWPQYGVLMLAMQLNAALSAPADVWFDEFAVGPTRMGCN